jgi:hypothetical protein
VGASTVAWTMAGVEKRRAEVHYTSADRVLLKIMVVLDFVGVWPLAETCSSPEIEG